MVDTFRHILIESGPLTASRYDEGLRSRVASLAAMPNRGQSLSDLRPHLRRLVYRSHIIYYATTGDRIFVLRVLHASRDQHAALDELPGAD